MAAAHDYFLGSIGPAGFSNFFCQLIGDDFPLRTYIIKGGPGCGKSTMMRRAAERALSKGHELELIHCSSDPASLDGVICRPLGFALVDGTAPHVLEPVIPAAKQDVVSLYHCLDSAALTDNLSSLRALFDHKSRCSERAARFTAAAGSLDHDIERAAKGALLTHKAERYAKNLAARLFPARAGVPGSETLRLTCAFTSRGVTDYAAANYSGCRAAYVFEDRFGAAAHAILEIIRDRAVAAGYDIVTGRSPMSPYDKINSVYVPALSTAFLHSGYISPAQISGAKLVRDRRFYDAEIISSCQKRLAFCKNAVLELLSEACSLLAEAAETHTEIEGFYKNSIDFGEVTACTTRLLAALGL